MSSSLNPLLGERKSRQLKKIFRNAKDFGGSGHPFTRDHKEGPFAEPGLLPGNGNFGASAEGRTGTLPNSLAPWAGGLPVGSK
jgi:hypothetical protein